MNADHRTLPILALILSLIISGCSLGQSIEQTITPRPTMRPVETETLIPTMIPIPTITPLPTITPTFQAATITTCDQYGVIDINRKIYVVQNNIWNPSPDGTQCLSVDNLTGAYTVTSQTNDQPTNGAPASYTFIYIGCHWGYCTDSKILPILTRDIRSVTSSWSITPAEGAWNAAYDIWFNTAPTASGVPDAAELMIWLNSQGGVWPGGPEVANNVNIAGDTYNIHYARHEPSLSYIAYRKTDITTFHDTDILAIINDAVSRGYIEPSWYLISVEAGFEIWNGGVGLSTNSFSVSINGGN